MDTLEIIRQLRADPALADELRAVLLSQELLQVPDRVAKIELQVVELRREVAEMDARLTSRLGSMDKRFDEVDERFRGVDERLNGVDKHLVSVDKRLGSVENGIGVLKGNDLERYVREHPRRYLGWLVRRAAAVGEQELEPLNLAEDEAEYLRQADLVVRGEDATSGGEVLAAVEVAWQAHQDDLDRALRRAGLLARASHLPSLAVVVSQEPPADVVVEHARSFGVGLVLAAGGQPLATASLRSPLVG